MTVAWSIWGRSMAAGLVLCGSAGCLERRNEELAEATQKPVEVDEDPEGLLKPGALEKIQSALREKGAVGEMKQGVLDEATSGALRKIQKANRLPATGVPDGRTVMALGLSPEEVLKRRPTE